MTGNARNAVCHSGRQMDKRERPKDGPCTVIQNGLALSIFYHPV